MSVIRMGEIQAKEGLTNELRDFLLSIMPGMLASAGCEGCQLLQSQDDPTKFTMIEVWDSIASHQASVKEIPPEMIEKIRPLIAGMVGGRYYDLIARE